MVASLAQEVSLQGHHPLRLARRKAAVGAGGVSAGAPSPSARETEGCGWRFTDTLCAGEEYRESPYLVKKMRLFAGSSRGSKLTRPTASTGKVTSGLTSGRGEGFLQKIFTLLRTPKATILVRAVEMPLCAQHSTISAKQRLPKHCLG